MFSNSFPSDKGSKFKVEIQLLTPILPKAAGVASKQLAKTSRLSRTLKYNK